MAKDSVGNVISHWSKLLEGFQYSPQEFYEQLQKAIEQREMPKASVSRVSHPEGGMGSGYREYFRLERAEHTVDVCAAPFGSGFFVSEWLSAPLKVNALAVVVMAICVAVLSASFTADASQKLVGLIGDNLWVLRQTLVVAIAILGWVGIIQPLYYPPRPTFYRIDTGLMFQKAVHAAILEVIDEITSAKGVRGLTELERQPILREFYMR
jgi:hypothetical protein